MQVLHPNVTQLIETPLAVGESPVWDDRHDLLLFEDIPAPAIFSYDPASGDVMRRDLPAPIGSFGLCEDGRAIVALKTGVHLMDLSNGMLELLVNPEADRPDNRLNDGKVGPDGRFWVGSMDATGALRPSGALYRIDHDGTATRMVDGLTVSNGLAWSPDGRTLYHSDSRQKVLNAYDYDLSSGNISNRRTLRTFDDTDGRPDGAAMDRDGYYWSAGVSAGCLNRIGPDGTIERKLMLPIPAPTMPCFGGPDLTTLYVTSLTSDRTGAGVSGTLLHVESEIAGAPVGRFRLRR